MKYLILILLALISLNVNAEIYKSIDANGNITYTDKPMNNNSTPVELPKMNATSSAPSTPSNQPPPIVMIPPMSSPQTNAAVRVNTPYVKFILASPADQESIQNQPNIPVTIEIEPALRSGDVIQIYLDGAPWGNALPETTFNFTAPDRGTHVISATLFDKSMRVIKQSNSNTIYVHHVHL